MDQFKEKLLSDKRVIDEIKRHLWIESEKAGHDIGFEAATNDWLKRFSKSWMEYHMPDELIRAKKSSIEMSVKQPEAATISTHVPKRRAKSYVKPKGYSLAEV